MKTILHTLKRFLAALPTHREAHLQLGSFYTTSGSAATTERRLSLEQQASPAAGEIMSTRRVAHLQLFSIYTELGRAAKLEQRHARTIAATQKYNLFGEQMTPAAG